MQLIKPLAITESVLASSSIAENDYPPWSSAISYAVGGRCIKGHRIWEALVAHTNADPETDASTPAKWLNLGATNRWRMFDDKVSTQSTGIGQISLTLTPGALVNALALLEVQARSVSITLTDPAAGTVYQRTFLLSDIGASNWYEYFLTDIERKTTLVVLPLPLYPAATIQVTLQAASESSPVACGHLLMGQLESIGTAVYGSSVGITDYSRKDVDEFGNYILIERPYSKRAEFDIAIETRRLSRIQRQLAKYRATPVLWIGHEEEEATILFGFYKDFDLVISGPVISDCTLTLEGLI